MIRTIVMTALLATGAAAQTTTTTTTTTEEKPVSFGGMTGTETRSTSNTQSSSRSGGSSGGFSFNTAQNSGSAAANQNRSQNQNADEALGEFLGALFGAQPQQSSETPQGDRQWRYAISRSGSTLCHVTLHEYQVSGGSGRYATPDANCPREWLGVRSYQLNTTSGELRLYDGAATRWSGRRVSDERYEGRGPDGQTYTLSMTSRSETPGGGWNDTPRYDFDPEDLYGSWRMSKTDSWSNCTVDFPRPSPDSAFQKPNAVNAPAGCPGQVMFAKQWFVSNGELKLADNFNKVKASLRQTGRNSWEGQTDRGEAIQMRR